MKYVIVTVALLTLVACAPKQVPVMRDSRVDSIIAAHNLVAGCLYDSKTFKEVKPCIYKGSKGNK